MFEGMPKGDHIATFMAKLSINIHMRSIKGGKDVILKGSQKMVNKAWIQWP